MLRGTASLFLSHFRRVAGGAVQFLEPLVECREVALTGVEPLEYLKELYPFLGEDEDDMDQILLLNNMIELTIFLVLHPHAALALVQRQMAYTIEEYGYLLQHNLSLHLDILSLMRYNARIVLLLEFIYCKFLVVIVQVLQSADEGLFRQL